FRRKVRCKYHLLYVGFASTIQKAIKLKLIGANTFERSKAPHQHVIETGIAMARFDHVLVGGRLDDAQQRGIAPGVGTRGAEFVFGKTIAHTAMAHTLNSEPQGIRQAGGPLRVMLKQMVSHAARGARSDSRQAPECVDERTQWLRLYVRLFHQNGNFIPGGNGRPAVTDDIFSCVVASALRSASLKAAATRSSS